MTRRKILQHEHATGPVRAVLATAQLLLSGREKWRLVLLAALVAVGVGLEVATLALIVPVMGILSDQTSIEVTRARLELPEQWTDLTLLVVVFASLTLSVFIKNVYALGSTWVQRTVVANISTRLSTELFEKYLRLPYGFHLKTNSSLLIRNMQNASNLLSSGIEPLIGLVTEILVTGGIAILLLIVSPAPSIVVVGVVGVVGYGLHRFVRARILRIGSERNRLFAIALQEQQQGLGAIKTLKVSGRESHFIDSYGVHVLESNLLNRTYGLLQQIPRLGIESLMVLALSSLIVLFVLQGRTASEAIPIVGLFGVAAFRIQPSVTRMLLHLQALSYSSAAISSVRNDYLLEIDEEPVEMPYQGELESNFNLLEFVNVSFRYSPDDNFVLRDASFSIRRGEYVGVSGRSGAGKSTVVDLMLGLLSPSQGSILLNGDDLRKHRRAWQRQIGFVPQDIYLVDDSIARNVSFGVELDDEVLRHVRRATDEAQLSGFISTLSDGYDTLVGEKGVRLSGGQRQRIGIARALFHSPAVMVFDEATSSLDGETEQEVLNAIESVASDRTVVVIAHRVSSLAKCDRILRVHDGTVEDCGPPTPDLLSFLAGDGDQRGQDGTESPA